MLRVVVALTLGLTGIVAFVGIAAAQNRVAARDQPAAVVVAASGDVLAGQGRATTTPQPVLVVGSRVAPQTTPTTVGDDCDEDFVSIYKAPPSGMGSVWLNRGFRASDFPGSPGGYPDGNAYFAKDRAIAESFERLDGYRDGIIAVHIPRQDYDALWAQYEVRYASAPGGTELIIPSSVVSGLNGYPRVWPA
ncbi:MAG: hypothetical protein ACRD2W_06060 [Acidimicrobiales bacterium]